MFTTSGDLIYSIWAEGNSRIVHLSEGSRKPLFETQGTRADLVGLYWIVDPKLRELGLVEHEDVALAEYEGYCRNILVQLRRVRKGRKLEQDHMRNRQMVVFWLIANTDAVKVERRDNKTYYRVTSPAKFREGCASARMVRLKEIRNRIRGSQPEQN